MRELNILLLLLCVLIIAAIVGGSAIFVWRASDFLTPMSAGIILGLGMAFVGMATILIPIFIYISRARTADMTEFLAVANKQPEGDWQNWSTTNEHKAEIIR